VFYGALAVFLVVFFLTIDYSELEGLSLHWGLIALALVVGLANRYWLTLIWLVILRGLGAPRPRSLAVMADVYAKSWLGRYIPGTLPWILGKIYFASQQGISKTKLAVSSLVEGGVQLLVQLLVGLALLSLDPRVASAMGGVWPLLVLAAVGCAVLLHPRVFTVVLSFVHRVVRKRPLDVEHFPRWRVMVASAGMYVVGGILGGTAAYLVAVAVRPQLGITDLLFVIAAINLASAVSMVAVFAPSGIGVREAVLVALFALIMPLEVAVVVAIVLRLWTIGADLAFLGTARLALMVDEARRRR
jgi:uncharacterized membrane protein YbhN (UPF0104 family)